MKKSTPRQLEVLAITDLTPHMRRITLGGEGMETFPQDRSGDYIKLTFPQTENVKPLVRTYTIRHQRSQEIDVDFVLHDAPGPASHWATNAREGDRILVGGPGPRKLISPDGVWFLFAGDMTALPAINVNLELLPCDARGYAVIEVLSEDDIQDLNAPENVEIHWLINPQPDPEGEKLVDRVRTLPWLEGEPAVWVATEFSSMRKLREYFRDVQPVAKSRRYVSSYWKMGVSEDAHKVAKKQDAALSEI